MADREKVILGIENCITTDSVTECRKTECPFIACRESCLEWLLRSALSLLKAQEPVLLENQHRPGGHFINANSPWISRCPKCGKKIEGKQTKFCKYCGQAVKWE